MISDTKTQCDVWLNKDVQLTIKDQMTMAGINEPFKLSITSTSFTQDEIKNMEKIQNNNDHVLTISKEGKHEIYLTKIKDGKENLFMYGYLTSNLYIRPSCGDCDFKGIPRQSDITLADFWGIESKLDDDKGTSLVLINNKKGKALFNRIENNIISFSLFRFNSLIITFLFF